MKDQVLSRKPFPDYIVDHPVADNSDLDEYDSEYEEDPDLPKEFQCEMDGEDHHDDWSSIGAMSGQHLTDLVETGCKPDLAEVANLTINVNYGDLANMASCPVSSRTKVVLIDPALTAEDTDEMTWSEMLDMGDSPARPEMDPNTPFLWTQGFDETCSLSGVSLTHDPATRPSRRPSDISTQSLSKLHRRPRPINALKRFLSTRRNRLGQGKAVPSDSWRTQTTDSTSSGMGQRRIWNMPQAA